MYMYLCTQALLNHKLISNQALKRIFQKKKKVEMQLSITQPKFLLQITISAEDLIYSV